MHWQVNLDDLSSGSLVTSFITARRVHTLLRFISHLPPFPSHRIPFPRALSSLPTSFPSAMMRFAVPLLAALVAALCFSAGSAQPSAIFHDANTVLTYRAIPSCAFNNHALTSSSTWGNTAMWQLGGESCLANIDYSPSGQFDTQAQFTTVTPTFNFTSSLYAGDNPSNRLAGGAAYLNNGVLIYGGGKAGSCPNPTYSTRTNDVMFSLNNGFSWAQATTAAQWCARSDFAMAAAPLTNNVVLIGGTCNGAVALNDVWLSSDGLGAYWTLQTANGPWLPWTQGSIVFMYDSPPTLVMYSPGEPNGGGDNAFFSSKDYGVTWTAGAQLTALNVNPNIDARLISDYQNNLYLVGGLHGNAQIVFSADMGKTASFVNQVNWSPNISNTVRIDYFEYGCLGFRYLPTSTAPGYHRQLVLYGGTIQVDSIVNSNYNCFFDTGSVAFPQTTSLQVELVFPGEVYSLPQAASPPPAQQPRLISHDAAAELTPRPYADCAYDVHQAVRKTANLSMWSMGGYDLNYNFANSVDYTATGNWNNIRVFQAPAYSGSPNGVAPSGRVAAGVALLSNGNLLYFAGKVYSATAQNNLLYVNDVYYSQNSGQSFTYSGQASFIGRSDFSTAVLPMTNTVVVVGGMYSATSAYNGAPMNDVWVSSDGQGAVWRQATAAGPFPQFTDGALVALYDGQAAGGPNPSSTLLLYVATYETTQTIYSSTNVGQSWAALSVAPWSYRQMASFVADADGFVYFAGGADQGDVWFSWNGGVSWFNLATAGNGIRNGFGGNQGFVNPSSLYHNLVQFIGVSGTTGNCMALRYSYNTQSPSNYHKQLILYGGATTIQVANRPSAACVQQTPVNVVYNELMFPSEYQNNAWTDTAAAPAPSTTPQIAFNAPNALFTYRQYSSCAYDVHSLVNHPSSPAQFALGGWDANGNVLSTYDRVNGNAFASYSYIFAYNPGAQQGNAITGRAAGGSGYLSNGNLLWFGGKTNQLSASSVLANDVWYTTNPSWTSGTWPPPAWSQATAAAPWSARSDVTTAVFPGTTCLLMVGGAAGSGNMNDVWQTCDGAGAQWTRQTASPAFLPLTDGAMVALFDGKATGGSQTTATVLLYPSTYPSYGQSIYTSTNAGVSWTMLSDAPWSSRFTAQFTADAENNVYMMGGQYPDTWYSTDKGNTWAQLQPTTSAGYSQPFQLASSTYACNFINYQSGSGPQGYHRQLTVYSGFLNLYSATLQVGGATSFGNFSVTQCLCDTISGVRAMVADLVFPGETVSTSSGNSGGGGGSTSYSAGQTAGIAVGVGVGCILLALFVVFLCLSMSRKRGGGGDDVGAGKPRKFENEPSALSNASNASQLEMAETNA